MVAVRSRIARCPRRPAKAAPEDRLRPGRSIRLEALDDLLGDGLAQHALDRSEEIALIDAKRLSELEFD